MNDLMSKLLASKKKDAKMSPIEKESHLSALKDLKSDMNGMLKGNLDSMKKVTVAAPSEEGLEEGLDKAKDMIEATESVDKEQTTETLLPEHMDGEMSEEQIDKMLMMLMEKKKELASQKEE